MKDKNRSFTAFRTTPEDVILRAAFCPCHPEEPQATKDLGDLKPNRSFATLRMTNVRL
ncbi:hypothetical protein [Aminivibrio sp.]|uniref:hypothetical protein n=1 Tax=Aminivibrio sp. TaxID=1872489 RepID=UPI003D98D19C